MAGNEEWRSLSDEPMDSNLKLIKPNTAFEMRQFTKTKYVKTKDEIEEIEDDEIFPNGQSALKFLRSRGTIISNGKFYSLLGGNTKKISKQQCIEIESLVRSVSLNRQRETLQIALRLVANIIYKMNPDLYNSISEAFYK